MPRNKERLEQEAREDAELRAGLEEIRAEWKREGGIEVSGLFRQLRAERKAKGRTSDHNR